MANPNLHKTKKYDTTTRKKLRAVIRDEWKNNSKDLESGSAFTEAVRSRLTAAGFKSPEGGALTSLMVKNQIWAAGVRFRRKNLVRNHKKTTSRRPRVAKMVESRPARCTSIPNILRDAIVDPTLTPSQRLRMVEAWFEV